MSKELARTWIAQDPDPTTRAELEALLADGDAAVIAERFAGRLEFGTAGIRGVLGAGPMRMNRVVVMQVTAGLAAYLAAEVDSARERGVVIGYDGRRMSREFAEDTARVLLGAGFAVHLIEGVVPTPVVAFAVTDRKAAGGVMVTASHNPPEYNGYKVYWENGAQIIPPHDHGISACIEQVGAVDRLPLGDLDAARASGSLVELGDDLTERYLQGVDALTLRPQQRAPLTVAYTPLHGVGGRFVDMALRRAGIDDVHIEPSQAEPDGDFPTVRFPNPEEEGAMDRVLVLASQVEADLVLANDPDADRLAVAVPTGAGHKMLTGDQIGVLLADYLLEHGPKDDARLVATTIVSSQMLGAMAAAHGAEHKLTLTGFKWLANAAMDARAATGTRFVLGYEEALGYSVGELVRDKDGVSAAVIFCELAARAKAAGETVLDHLENLYRRYGVFVTKQHSLVLPGADGLERIRGHMKRLRDQPPQEIGGFAVRERHDIAEGALGLPPSDVLVFLLEGDRRVIVRPSGTEPKLKCYYEVREPVAEGESVVDATARAEAELEKLLAAHQSSL